MYELPLSDWYRSRGRVNDANYAAAVTTDANMNITEIDESYDNGNGVNHLYTYFDVDALNKVTAQRTKQYISLASKWQWTKRAHGYDAAGRLVNTTMKQWYDGDAEPAGDSLEHIYDRGRMLQNYDGTSTYGDEWRWAGAQQSHNSPLHSPNSDTASQTGYNLANDKTPQRRSFLSPTSEGDQRNLYGQGKPQAKDSSGSGANWYVGTTSQPQTVQMASIESRLFFEGTVTATDMDRATDTREKGRIGITGSAQSYGGSNGRVTSEAIGRDVNPLGRGGGAALIGGMLNVGSLAPKLPGTSPASNQGNSVNNSCIGCIGAGGGTSGGDGGSLLDVPPDSQWGPWNWPEKEVPRPDDQGSSKCGTYSIQQVDDKCRDVCNCNVTPPSSEWCKNPCCGKWNEEEQGCDCVPWSHEDHYQRHTWGWNWCGTSKLGNNCCLRTGDKEAKETKWCNCTLERRGMLLVTVIVPTYTMVPCVTPGSVPPGQPVGMVRQYAQVSDGTVNQQCGGVVFLLRSGFPDFPLLCGEDLDPASHAHLIIISLTPPDPYTGLPSCPI